MATMTEGQVPNHVLDSAREFVETLKAGPEDEKLNALFEEIDQFGPQARTYLQFLTNAFLEPDILEKTMQNPESVEEIRQKFTAFGVREQGANMVVEYFAGKLSGKQKPTTP